MKTFLRGWVAVLVVLAIGHGAEPAARPVPAAKIAELKKHFPEQRRVMYQNKFDMAVPSPDVWSRYRGDFWVLTAGNAAAQLPRIEARIARDVAEMQKKRPENESAAMQQEATRSWLEQTLRPYLAQWKAVVGAARK